MSANDLHDLIAKCRKDIELGEAVNQLNVLPTFKSVITTHLFNAQVSLLVSKLASFRKDSVEYAEVVRELDAISYLQTYLHQLTVNSVQAECDLKEAQHYLYNEG
jgi:hypothetical protein